MARRIIKKSQGFKIIRDPDWNEYAVGPVECSYHDGPMYYTSDKDDAYDTFDHMVKEGTQVTSN